MIKQAEVALTPLSPFEPLAVDQLPTGKQWIGQIKWDGVRVLSYYDGRHIRLFNRRQNERTLQYPELAVPGQYCSANSYILDGEVIAFEQGKPSFHEVMKRDSLRTISKIKITQKSVPVTYMIFDVLYANGVWLTGTPLSARQQLLQQIVIPSERIQLVPSYDNLQQLLDVSRQHDLEGIVIKDLTSLYVPDGKDKRWRKIKHYQDLIAVVGGVTYRDGIINGLLLGLYNDKQQLVHIGHAGSGKLKQDEWKQLTAVAAKLRISAKPFINEPERSKEAHWIQPQLTVKVAYLEWTASQTLRQPTLQAIVHASPAECLLEEAISGGVKR